jgi:ABC-type siderophore export system fused ATPase/permease subunit
MVPAPFSSLSGIFNSLSQTFPILSGQCILRQQSEYRDMTPAPITDYILTPHAQWELSRRGLSETTIHAILSAQVSDLRSVQAGSFCNRKLFQAQQKRLFSFESSWISIGNQQQS